MQLRSSDARRGLGWIAGTLDNISFVEIPPNNVPDVPLNRLNEHYSDVVALSRLILRHTAFESGRGTVRASGFLMIMNVVFQDFVTAALRERPLGFGQHPVFRMRDTFRAVAVHIWMRGTT